MERSKPAAGISNPCFGTIINLEDRIQSSLYNGLSAGPVQNSSKIFRPFAKTMIRFDRPHPGEPVCAGWTRNEPHRGVPQ